MTIYHAFSPKKHSEPTNVASCDSSKPRAGSKNYTDEQPRLGQSPPRPQLVLRIGITGHRSNRIGLDAQARIATAIDALVVQLESELRTVHEDSGGIYEGDPKLRLLSAVAEGADRLAAHAMLARGHDLQIVLPLAREDYAKDFSDPASVSDFEALLRRASAVFELRSDRTLSRAHAYEGAGFFMLRQSDILLAVWDGEAPRGRGGTANIVARAAQSGIPVIWLDVAGTSAPRMLWMEQAKTDSEGFDFGALSWQDFAGGQAKLVRTLLAPPQPGSAEHDRLSQFLSERQPAWNMRLEYPLLLWLTGVRRPRWSSLRPLFDASTASSNWKDFLARIARAAEFPPGRLSNVLLNRFFWSDNLAAYYGQTFRSGYVANFLLAAAAVAMALSGIVAPSFKSVWVLIELAMIGLVLANTLFAGQRRWHERWLDYRHVAEELRHLRFLVMTGSRVRRVQRDVTPDPSWAHWYAAATHREIGLPHATADSNFVDAVQRILGEIELAEQVEYHRQNSRRLEMLHHQLHKAGILAFSGTAVVCIAFLISDQIDHDVAVRWAPWATFLTALLPAVGAALYGIRVQGDFDGVAHRSSAIADRLDEMRQSLQHSSLSYAVLAQMAEQASDVMLAEISDWQLVFQTRPLDLPA